MCERFPLRAGEGIEGFDWNLDDDAAAVYPDHDIVTRHFDGPLTIGDFVSAFADSAEMHGGLPTYLRLTLRGDAAELRRLMTENTPKDRAGKRLIH